MKRFSCITVLSGLLALAGCDDARDVAAAVAKPIDECEGLDPITLTARPTAVRVLASAALHPEGGSGRYTFVVASGGSGGEVRAGRLVAGATPGVDRVTVRDDCGGSADVEVTVEAGFSVAPVRAAVRPGTSFQLRVAGTLGAPSFRAQTLASGGTLDERGRYTAGATAGLDLLAVKDLGSGEEVLLQVRVDPAARLRAEPAYLGVPAGTRMPLVLRDGSGVARFEKVSGAGRIEDGTFVADPDEHGAAVLTATDEFTGETTRIDVQVLVDLAHPGRPHGRLTDVGNLVAGDFDGDGFEDVALGVPDSDLGRPLGGAVFVFRGSAAGVASEPTWTIAGESETGGLGSVLAAGDLDGDGRADLAISEPGADVTVADSGAVLLYRFTARGPELLRPRLTGLGRGSFGAALAIADVDADGDRDLVVGSPGADLAPSSKVSARGVVDVYLLEKGRAIPDLGMLRVGGVDLAADGSFQDGTQLRFGRGLAVADFDGDGRADLASLGSVTHALAEGAPPAKSQAAIALHFGRAASPLFEARPDLYVLPSDPADGAEGTFRLLAVEGRDDAPARLVITGDQLDAPDLSSAGGDKAAVNAGGALVFELSEQRPASPSDRPVQLSRLSALARIWGDGAEGYAGRGATVTDVDGDGKRELLLGAPRATVRSAAGDLTLAGKLLVYPFDALTPGARLNRALDVRLGARAADALGVAVLGVGSGATRGVVALAGRASTTLGDFTGRLDVLTGRGSLATFAAREIALPARLAVQQHGASVALAAGDTGVRALVGMPGYAGRGARGDGNELGAGQALVYAEGDALGRVLHEGASRAYASEGRTAFGGRGIGGSVTWTDFDGDEKLDAVVSAPELSTATSATSGEYAGVASTCLTANAQTNGGALVFLAGADGTLREGFRVALPSAIASCTPVDDAKCKRSGIARFGLAGGFDFDGDGKQDLALTRDKGLEIVLGRAPSDVSLAKPSLACDSVLSLPALALAVSSPAALGDLDGDGCDEVSLRYADGTRSGLVVAFGFASDGKRCRGRTKAAWLRLSGDAEVGLANLQLGIAAARAGKLLGDARDFVAVSAGLYPFEGTAQPSVLLFDVAALSARRPAAGEALVGALDADLAPRALVYRERAPGFGRSLAGNVDLDGDGQVDLVVAAPGASVNGDGVGAVFAFRGGADATGRLSPWLTIVGDGSERASVGQSIAAIGASATTPAALLVGAPLSYRSGTANGTAWLMVLTRAR